MMPFDSYPGMGRQMLGKVKGASCRREYGLTLQQLTGQTRCCFCGLDLVGTFEHWLMMSLDHAIPFKAGTDLGIPADWLHDYGNLVLCCSGCNGYKNRVVLPSDVIRPESEAEFFDLRDQIFGMRVPLIASRLGMEREFYERRHWQCV